MRYNKTRIMKREYIVKAVLNIKTIANSTEINSLRGKLIKLDENIFYSSFYIIEFTDIKHPQYQDFFEISISSNNKKIDKKVLEIIELDYKESSSIYNDSCPGYEYELFSNGSKILSKRYKAIKKNIEYKTFESSTTIRKIVAPIKFEFEGLNLYILNFR